VPCCLCSSSVVCCLTSGPVFLLLVGSLHTSTSNSVSPHSSPLLSNFLLLSLHLYSKYFSLPRYLFLGMCSYLCIFLLLGKQRSLSTYAVVFLCNLISLHPVISKRLCIFLTITPLAVSAFTCILHLLVFILPLSHSCVVSSIICTFFFPSYLSLWSGVPRILLCRRG